MITVEIYVPSVNTTLSLSLDENADISSVIRQLSEAVAEDETETGEAEKEFFLACRNYNRILNPEKTLAFYNIRSGDSLLLI